MLPLLQLSRGSRCVVSHHHCSIGRQDTPVAGGDLAASQLVCSEQPLLRHCSVRVLTNQHGYYTLSSMLLRKLISNNVIIVMTQGKTENIFHKRLVFTYHCLYLCRWMYKSCDRVNIFSYVFTGIYLTNPLDVVSESAIYEQLTSDSVAVSKTIGYRTTVDKQCRPGNTAQPYRREMAYYECCWSVLPLHFLTDLAKWPTQYM